MYLTKCVEENRQPQKFWLYEYIFNTEFNLGFYHPKKDLCSICEAYKQSNDADKAKQVYEYEQHIKRKETVREQKKYDKDNALHNKDMCLLNFDLQKVLISPKTNIGEVYYYIQLFCI